jgi:hypothetical protein
MTSIFGSTKWFSDASAHSKGPSLPPASGGSFMTSGKFNTTTAGKKTLTNKQHMKAGTGPGQHYEGWFKHPFYFNNQERTFRVTRLPPTAAVKDAGGMYSTLASQTAADRKNAEPQIIAWVEGINIAEAFGKNGLKELIERVDKQGALTGNVSIRDPHGHTSSEGEFHLAKKNSNIPNAPDPLGLSVLRFGSEKRSSLEHDQAWHKWATQKGMYGAPPKMSNVDAQTTLTAQVRPGQTKLAVVSNAGFQIGREVIIDAGSSAQEKGIIDGFSSLILEKPVRYHHHQGARVTMPSSFLWYREDNNWVDMLQRCAMEMKDISLAYPGDTRMEWRDEMPRFDESVANWMYEVSGGKYGIKWIQEAHKEEVPVVDIFEDRAFGSPNKHNEKSWWMPGDPNFDPAEQPAKWERLYDTEAEAENLYDPVRGTDPHSPMPGRIYQGDIDDLYFVQAMVMIAMKSKLVVDVFNLPENPNTKSAAFACRFYKHGQWVSVIVDGFLPYDKDDNPMCCRHEAFPGRVWPSILEKAYAKLHGSWMAIGDKGGDVEEALVDLTGGVAGRFNTMDVAADRLWKYFSELKATTIWGCGIDNAECSKRNIPIAKHWASAIFDVSQHQGMPVVGVFTCAPWSSVQHFPLIDMNDDKDWHEGYMWLRIDDFCQLFTDVYECRLTNSDLVPFAKPTMILPPGRPDPGVFHGGQTPGHKAGPWYETLWGYRGDADMATSPSFLIHVMDATELVMDISQECSRYQAAMNGKERRTDLVHGMHNVLHEEYIEAMHDRYPDYARGQLEDMWEQQPIDASTVSNPDSDGTGYYTRAPMLLCFCDFINAAGICKSELASRKMG